MKAANQAKRTYAAAPRASAAARGIAAIVAMVSLRLHRRNTAEDRDQTLAPAAHCGPLRRDPADRPDVDGRRPRARAGRRDLVAAAGMKALAAEARWLRSPGSGFSTKFDNGLDSAFVG